MPTPFAEVPLRRFVDADQWDADDLAGRLSIVAHAAFLSAGFVPTRPGHLLLKHVDEIGPSAPLLSRRYTAPQLVARGDEGAAEVGVLEMRAQGDGDVAFQAYLLTTDGHRRCSCEALLDEAALAPILSGGVDDAARELETGAAGSWLWKSLADWVCRVLFLQLCRRNHLPVTGFVSLPDDAMVEILKRLADGKDLARVECSSRPLRRLVAERDGELWKAKALVIPGEEGSLDLFDPWFSLSELESFRDLLALSAPSAAYTLFPLLPMQNSFLMEPVVEEYTSSIGFNGLNQSYFSAIEQYFPLTLNQPTLTLNQLIINSSAENSPTNQPPYLVLNLPTPAAAASAPEVIGRSRQFGGRNRKVPRKDDKIQKRHGAGATHSPSSRHRWRHR